MKPEAPDGCGLCLMGFIATAGTSYLIYNLYGVSWYWSPFLVMAYMLGWGMFFLKRIDKFKKQAKEYDDYHDKWDKHW